VDLGSILVHMLG